MQHEKMALWWRAHFAEAQVAGAAVRGLGVRFCDFFW